ncbi:MAG: TonB-dependent receptor [Bacteroidetes bacterium]|nr:TonB-dependent receptor [Bacteroidota bacterium]
MKTGILFFTLLTSLFHKLTAQSPTQTVRGSVFELGTGNKIETAEICCTCDGLMRTVFTDSNGYFRLENVPVGRQSFVIIKAGFLDRTINNMDVSAGKELVLQIAMEEKAEQLKEAKITIQKNPREKPLNVMATVSARQFNVEETQRYAAAVNDPARMAMGFAGVTAPDDGNNLIVIRGNSPNGLIWRMEGMDIPNPNHFSNVGTSGGGITILSAQLLSNSDFFTGAFPAEYGNGLSGVFDLKLRKGNNEKKEHTIQFGLLGLDVASEGPAGKKGGSYLVNYRYSTLSMISALGIELGDAVTKFQDLSYHVNLPVNKKLTVSFFGFTGLSNQFAASIKDSTVWLTREDKQYDWRFMANSIFNGAKANIHISPRHNLEIKTGLGITQNGYSESKLNSEYSLQTNYKEKYNQYRGTFSAESNFKPNSKHLFRSGILLNYWRFNLQKQALNNQNILRSFLDADGNTSTAQIYSQWQYRLNSKFTMNSGIHALALMLNKTWSVEPRFGMKYQLGKNKWLSAGVGVHGQMQPLGTYFYKNEQGVYINKNLKLSKAFHYITGYDQLIGKNWHIKSELYYQQLKNLPGSPETGNTYCSINSLDGFYTDTLVSRAKGRNYGAEITIEKFFTNSTYLLLTGSLSDSKYTDAHGNQFNTRFNVGHTLSLLAGKEWNFKKNRLGINIKTMWIGGLHDMPIDVEASEKFQKTVRDLKKTYQWKNPDYFRIDTKISYKINHKKHSSTWSLDIQNATNRKNVWGTFFNTKTKAIEKITQTPLIPILAYKLEF